MMNTVANITTIVIVNHPPATRPYLPIFSFYMRRAHKFLPTAADGWLDVPPPENLPPPPPPLVPFPLPNSTEQQQNRKKNSQQMRMIE